MEGEREGRGGREGEKEGKGGGRGKKQGREGKGASAVLTFPSKSLGWAVTFGTARRGLGGQWSRPVPSSLYQI